MLGDILTVALTAGVGSVATTAAPAWATVAGYHGAATVTFSGNNITVDLSKLGSKAPSAVTVFVQTKEQWPQRPRRQLGMTRIAELRRERKLTQVELAMAAGVSRTTVAYLEQGYVPRSSYYAIPAIAERSASILNP